MIRFSYVYLSFHLVGGKQPSFPLLYCCVVLFVVEGSCAQSAFVSLLLPVRIALVFWEVILFSVPCPPPPHRLSPRPLCGTGYAHSLLFIAEKPHNETSLRNHTDMYSGESTLASGDLHDLTPLLPNLTYLPR